jgi:CRISPR/Cas system-associated protein Cas7 (RAMP superfamily)
MSNETGSSYRNVVVISGGMKAFAFYVKVCEILKKGNQRRSCPKSQSFAFWTSKSGGKYSKKAFFEYPRPNYS